MRIFRFQATKFALVGIANTIIDFIVLNALILAFGLWGQMVVLYRAIAFLAAVLNSYYWNRRWVFKSESRRRD